MNLSEVKKIVKAMNTYHAWNGGDFRVEEVKGINKDNRNKDYAEVYTEDSIYTTGVDRHKDTENPFNTGEGWWTMEYVVENEANKLMRNEERFFHISVGRNDTKGHNRERVPFRTEYRISISDAYDGNLKNVHIDLYVNYKKLMSTKDTINMDTLIDRPQVIGSQIVEISDGIE